MTFSKSVREQALIESARHCCVCHRYKGVKIEVHHIVPLDSGGDDSPDNAIALCFDCHADAGHYNPKHPRGSKFSPDELLEARETWHRTVRSQGLSGPEAESQLHSDQVNDAEAVLLKALEIGYNANNQPNIATSKRLLGRLSLHRQDWESAEKYYRESLAIDERLGHRVKLARSYRGPGEALSGAGQTAKGEEMLSKANEILEQVGIES